MKDLTLRQLEYFVTVAREGSITRAALRCHVTQAAISQSVQDLEQALGLPLLIRRRSRGVTLTAAGRTVATRANRLLDEARRLVDRADDTVHTGTFTMGCFPSISPIVLPEVAEFLAREHPKVSLRIVEATAPELQERLLRGELDACFLLEMQVSAEVDTILLRELPVYVLVGADHPLADRPAIRLVELADHPAAVLDVVPANYLNEDRLRRFGVVPNVAYRSSDIRTIRNLAGRGLAWALTMQVVDASEEGRPLRFLPIVDDIGTNSLMAAHPPGVPPSGLAAAVVSHCATALSNLSN